ncbi:fungal-specific transcription factor domain-containing protein [Dactylonectria estremocensis]|uniref:Fungal-specific transcription factor domain-containing protein n=1 Tax=Dactylonectria estremocensis TaxID=1079267 RepID=A0A9P9EHY5_9HYPO|nr:fungal-specific transcription factor domain-containing protein [Dactylonectria estremocensis]
MRSTSNKRSRPTDPDDDPASSKKIRCKQCRTRKVKCGGEYPSCLGCVKANVPCLVSDPTASRDFTRVEVQQLETKIQRIQSLLASTPLLEDLEQEQGTVASGESLSVAAPRFVGPESGADFFLSILDLFRRQLHSTTNSVISQQPQPSPIVYHAPHPFPPLDVATQAIREYFREFHHSHPFLTKPKVYASLSRQPSLAHSPARPDKHCLFQLNMVLAIGSVRLFRDRITNLHPFGFFTAALEASPPSGSTFSTLEDIENLLLVARFGYFYNIGCSLWDLGRLCIRIAVELNLHQKQPSIPLQGRADLQRCRNVFWDSYLLDRLSSSTLGRPFAIDDSAIETELPTTDSPDDGSPDGHGAKMGVFNWLIGLGQITSQIHSSMNEQRATREGDMPVSFLSQGNPRSTSQMGETYPLVRRFHSKLREWRLKAPTSNKPSCLYESDGFFELSYQETRLWLLRAAIDRLPSTTTHPPRTILKPCYQAACGIIDAFDKLRDAGLVTFTRAYMHLVFIASLVVISITHVYPLDSSQNSGPVSPVDLDHWLKDLDDGAYTETVDGSTDILGKARDSLCWLGDGMPDVALYARFFQALEQDLLRARRAGPDDHQDPRSQNWHNPNGENAMQWHETEARNSADSRPTDGLLSQEDANAGLESDEGQHFPMMDSSINLGICLQDSALAEAIQDGYMGIQPSHSTMWPMSDFLGMEGLDLEMSNFVWDMAYPWQDSPPMP